MSDLREELTLSVYKGEVLVNYLKLMLKANEKLIVQTDIEILRRALTAQNNSIRDMLSKVE